MPIGECIPNRLVSSRKLRAHFGSNFKVLWQQEYLLAIADSLELSEAEIRMWIGPVELAKSYNRVKIRNENFRILATGKGYNTQDSGVAVTVLNEQGTASRKKFGRIVDILQIHVGGEDKVVLKLHLFKISSKHQRISGVHLVSENNANTGPTNVLAEKIDGQVFFTATPGKEGYLNVFAYRGSSYQIPDHHLDIEGRLLDV